MLRDTVPYDEFARMHHKNSARDRAIASFVRFVEDKLGARMTYDAAQFRYFRPDLADLMQLAERMRAAGVIRSYSPRLFASDEPPYAEWRAVYREGDDGSAAGSAVDDDRAALTAALAEATERYLWFESGDHFVDERELRYEDMLRIGQAVDPRRYASFSDEQRVQFPQLALRDVPYIWTQAKNLIDDSSVYVPAQISTGVPRIAHRRHRGIEPMILYPITNGLATWTSREGARLRGLLEVIERDAFTITWLNQITASRFDVDALAQKRESLAALAEKCRRYRLEPNFIRLVTDAPTYAVMAVVEDRTGHAPRYGFGVKASADPARAAEGALFEALRGRRAARYFLESGAVAPAAEDIGHTDRILYWAEGDRASRLSFLIEGAIAPQAAEWENESDEKHFARLKKWIDAQGYIATAVPFTHAKNNLTPWHIEFVNVPELQPMYFNERQPHIGGSRLTEVPRRCGFTARAQPFLDEPHPFA